MMECKRALKEAGGDIDQATRLLRERGEAIAAKKATREANEGLIGTAKSDDGRTAALVEVNCETDFVARNESFVNFVKDLAQRACDNDDSLANEVKDDVQAKVTEIGENIVLRRNTRMQLEGSGRVESYVHLGGKVGVLVEVNCEKDETVESPEFVELSRDLTLHVAACAPSCLSPDQLPEDEVAAEREIFAKQVADKPPEILEKIVDGKMRKYYQEVCLLEQGFVKEPKTSITSLLGEKGKALGDTLSIRGFEYYQLGVG